VLESLHENEGAHRAQGAGLLQGAALFTPAGFDPTSKEKFPALAFIGPMSGPKNQVTGVYARKLAALGYVRFRALALSHAWAT
jgi:hypothetical protein